MLEECYNFAGDVRINRYIVGCKYVPDMKIYSEDD